MIQSRFITLKKTSLVLSIQLLVFLTVFGQIPAGYYDSAVGKKQAELKTALHLIIKNATTPSYGSGAGSTWAAFSKTDVRPEDGTVWDMYSSYHVAFSGTSAASGCNIEHSLANSWWGGTKNQTYNDLFNLNPSNSSANSSKGSWPIAVVDGTTSYSNGVIKVGKSSSRPGGIIDAWEPADEYKGDFARSYMYMVTSYEDLSTKWTGNSVNQLDNNTYPVFEQWTVDLFLKWCAQDPVSQKEIDRNNEIYKIQGNRNPYIDYPLMAEYVWGKLMTVPFAPDGNVNFPYLNSPSNAAIVDFGKVAFQQTDTASVWVKASNLTGDLTLAITGTDAAYFSIQNPTITKTDAENGYKLIVNYNAQTVGTQTAQLSISGGGITSTSLTLKVISSDQFVALAATNVSSSGFTANWSVSANATGYTIQVFSLQNTGSTQPKTLLEEDFLSGLPTGWTQVTYTDNLLASNMRLASGSSGGKISTPPLNLSVAGAVLSVRAKQYNSDNGAPLTATLDNLPLAVWTTGVANQDFSISLAAATATSIISLSATSGSRVYVDYVKVATQGSVQSAVMANGYPKSAGNVFSLQVNGLVADSSYYYSVTPEGNNVPVSNQIQVRTLKTNTGLEFQHLSPVKWLPFGKGILVQNLPENCQLKLLDISGKELQHFQNISGQLELGLSKKGTYLLQIIQNQKFNLIKVLF